MKMKPWKRVANLIHQIQKFCRQQCDKQHIHQHQQWRPRGESIPIPSGRSIAHHHIADNKAVILSLDIETAGEYVGIVQLSCEIVRFTLVPGHKVNNDTIANVTSADSDAYKK